MRELIIGGARSGKSAHAERLADESGLRVVYVATAQVLDGEMERRVAVHRARRPADWGLVESPLNLAETLHRHARSDTCLLVDCLTLWLSNLLFAGEVLSHENTPWLLNSGVKNAMRLDRNYKSSIRLAFALMSYTRHKFFLCISTG